MKKELLVFVFMMLPLAMNAAELINGIYYNLNTDTQTAEVVYNRRYKYRGDVVIPSTVTSGEVDYRVTSIQGNAFFNSIEMTSVFIPSTVTNIGSGIFQGCTGLSSIVIEDGNTVYDSREKCNAVIVTSSNTLISGCQLSTIPSSVTTIAASAFSGCIYLKAIHIPDGVVSIGESAFRGCTGLTSVDVGSGLETIGTDAFSDCSSLTRVGLNSNAIVSKAYNANPRICDIFGSQVEEYVIGEDVTSVGDFAFSECPQLTTVHLGSNLTSIGSSAFSFCYNLTEINIPSRLTDIGSGAFETCNSLVKVEIHSNTLLMAGTSLKYHFGSQVKEYILGDEVTNIAGLSFSDCNSLTTVTIPGGVESIGDYAFHRCYQLKDMYLYAEQIPQTGNDVFGNIHINATLHVPAGSLAAYQTAEVWKDFGNIVALTGEVPNPTEIKVIDNKAIAVEHYYTVDGRQTSSPCRGLNIVKSRDGKIYKVWMK